MKKLYMAVLTGTAVFCCLLSCSKSDDSTVDTSKGKITVTETSDGVEVRGVDGALSLKGSDEEGHIKIKTKDGGDMEVRYNQEKLPVDFPEDIPVYSPSKVTMSQVLNKGVSAMATLSTQDESAKVIDYYKKELAAKGWTIDGEMNLGGVVMFQGKKGSSMLNVSVMKSEDGTNITLAKTIDE
jgi:hypothetical protein